MSRDIEIGALHHPGAGGPSVGLIANYAASNVAAASWVLWMLLRRHGAGWLVFAAVNYLLLFVADFSTYCLVHGTPNNWGMRLSHIDALLVTLGTLTTAGTSGLTAHSELARRVLVVEMAVQLTVVGALLGLVVARLAQTTSRHPRKP